jgi:predicted nuclease of predicted toxin-antitoxin system
MLPLLIDENLNHRILRGLLRSVPHLDYLLAPDAGLKGANDPAVLDFAARENRVLATHDLRTVPKHAYERVKAGLPMPGVIAISDDLPIRAGD